MFVPFRPRFRPLLEGLPMYRRKAWGPCQEKSAATRPVIHPKVSKTRFAKGQAHVQCKRYVLLPPNSCPDISKHLVRQNRSKSRPKNGPAKSEQNTTVVPRGSNLRTSGLGAPASFSTRLAQESCASRKPSETKPHAMWVAPVKPLMTPPVFEACPSWGM